MFGQVVLIQVRTEATGLRRGGSGVPSGCRRGALVFRTVPAKPPAGHGGGPRRRTQERRVSPCVHKQLDARTSVSDSHIRGSLKEGRAPGPTAGRSAGPQRAPNTETCVGALKEDTNFIEECVPCLSPDPPAIPHLGPSLSWEIIGRARSRG